jgi:protein ImuA
METPPTNDIQNPVDLGHLFDRGDIWVGQAKRSAIRSTVSSGNASLDEALSGGWPLGSLVEICQHTTVSAEWTLFAAAMSQQSRPVFLLNPPMVPFSAAIVDLGIDLNQVYVLRTTNKASFVNAFVELARASQCGALLAWQPEEPLTYTELRKFALACAEGRGLYSLFRPISAQQESSPAALRVAASVHRSALRLSIFKQRGMLETHDKMLGVELNNRLDGHLPLNQLHEMEIPGVSTPRVRRKANNVIPLRRR